MEVLPTCEPSPVGPVEVGRESLLGFKVYIGDDEVQLRSSMIPMLDPNRGEPVGVYAGNQKIALEAVDQLKASVRARFEPHCIVLGEAQNS
jgi:hypothetical protein